MRFHSYEMWINSTDKFSKQDMRDAVSKANTKFQDGDMLYLIQLEILEERFLWLACDYENIFKETISKTGLDVKEVQIKIGFGDTPVKDARSLLEWIHRERDAFERVIVVGVDDNDIEQTFDYSSILKHVELHLNKDEDEHYDASEVKSELLKELRNSGNV